MITKLQAALLLGKTDSSRAHREEILRLAGLLDTYNNSGDDEPIVPGDQLVGSADPNSIPNGARTKAVLSFANCNR